MSLFNKLIEVNKNNSEFTVVEKGGKQYVKIDKEVLPNFKSNKKIIDGVEFSVKKGRYTQLNNRPIDMSQSETAFYFSLENMRVNPEGTQISGTKKINNTEYIYIIAKLSTSTVACDVKPEQVPVLNDSM